MTRFLFLSSFLLSVCAVAVAQPPASSADPFVAAISSIIERNPDVASRQALVLADAADASDENALENPEVAFSRVWGAKGIGNKLQLDISQSFDWPGVYAMRRLANRHAKSAAQLMVDDARFKIASEANALLIELVFVRKQIVSQTEISKAMSQLGNVIDRGLETGELTLLDQKKQRIELFKLENTLSGLRSRQEQIIAQLRALAGDSPVILDAIDSYPIMQMLSAEAYKKQVVEYDPLYASNAYAASAAQYSAKAAMQSRFPSFTLGYQHQAEMGDRFNGFTMAMTLPFFQGRHARSASLKRMQAAELDQHALLATRYSQIEGDIAEAKLWQEQARQYEQVFGDHAYLPMLSRVYTQGELTAIDYIAELHYYSEVTEAALSAEYNYYQALASLNRYDLWQALK